MYVFISHSSKDSQIAEDICKILEKNDHECFLSFRDIRSGREYAEEILNGIERADVLLLLLSGEANKSPHVLREIERAVSKKTTIIVYKTEEVELTKSMEYFLMSHQWLNTSPSKDYKEILDCINAISVKLEARNTETPELQEKPVQKTKVKTSKTKVMMCLAVVILCLVVGLGFGLGVNRSKEKANELFPETVALGDSITFGTYNGEPIEWRVLRMSEDGSEAVLVAQQILTMKAYDVAEGGKYNYYDNKDYWVEDIPDGDVQLQHIIQGNNAWEVSNIRTWLNATRENVIYEDQAPIAAATSEFVNGYDNEAGFLSGFSEQELAAIVETEVETDGVTTMDKVFLLSSEELDWFREADISLAAIPTQAALEQDKADWYEMYLTSTGAEDFCWWLRDTAADAKACEAYIVSNSFTKNELGLISVGLEGYGIRPAVTVKITAQE